MDSNNYEFLLSLLKKMENRNLELGDRRFDFGDILSSSFYNKYYDKLPRILALFLRIPEVLFPFGWRKLFGVNKRIIPVAYYHLGMCSLIIEDSFERPDTLLGSRIYADKAIEIGKKNGHLCWEHPYDHHGQKWKEKSKSNGYPNSCAHHTARLASFLLSVGKFYNDDNYICKGNSAIQALIEYHNWHFYEDGRCSVSYYPNTNDEVINTAAEVGEAISMLPENFTQDVYLRRLSGIVRMVLKEMNDDGSWYYCSKQHYEEVNRGGVIDNHHTAMIIKSLVNIISTKRITKDLTKSVKKAVSKGVDYYIDQFVTESGFSYGYSHRVRETTIAGYCEGIIALTVLLENRGLFNFDRAKLQRIRNIVDKLVGYVLDNFLIDSTADIATYRVLTKPINLQSIRLGSGLFMEALSRYLKIEMKGIM